MSSKRSSGDESRGKRAVIPLDTAAVALTNAAVVLAGARMVAPTELTSLAMFQLLVATTVGLQRAAFLSPALSSRRVDGVTAIPTRWLPVLTFPMAIVGAIMLPWLVGSDLPYTQLVLLASFVAVPALSQDLLRYAQFTRDDEKYALIADCAWLCCLAIGMSVLWLSPSATWMQCAVVWGSGAWVSAAGLLARTLYADRVHRRQFVSVASAWRLGRWSGADAALSGAANLLPLVVTTLALGTPAAAIYRVFQTVNGPFNILNATFMTTMGLNSWKLSEVSAVIAMRRQVFRGMVAMAVFALLYYAVALPATVVITGIAGEDVLRVGITLGATGVLSAATIPVIAAASAMGYQKVGLIVRLFVVGTALVASSSALVGLRLPWNDPVAVVAIASSLLGFAGWTWGYSRGVKREISRERQDSH